MKLLETCLQGEVVRLGTMEMEMKRYENGSEENEWCSLYGGREWPSRSHSDSRS